MSLGTQGVQAKCPRKALVYGVSVLGIVKVNLENLVLRHVFEIEEAKQIVGSFWSAI